MDMEDIKYIAEKLRNTSRILDDAVARNSLISLMSDFVELLQLARDSEVPDSDIDRYFHSFRKAYGYLRKPEGKDERLDDIYEDALSISIPTKRLAYVYVLKRLDGLHKIGHTSNFHERFKALSRQYGELETIHVINSLDSASAEKRLHHYFASYRIEGEWFNLNTRQIRFLKRIKRL